MKNLSELTDVQLAIIRYSVGYLMDNFEENDIDRDAMEIITMVSKEIERRYPDVDMSEWIKTQLKF